MKTRIASRPLILVLVMAVTGMLGLVSAPTQPALAATCTVTSTADAGPGTAAPVPA